jgi:hypothetical protein
LGSIVNIKNLFNTENELKETATEYGIKTLKDLRDTSNLRKEVKVKATDKLASIMEKYEIQVISCILSYRNFKISGSKNENPIISPQLEKDYEEALTFLVERFYLFLKRNQLNGIIIFDEFKGKKDFEKSVYNFLSGKKSLIEYLPTSKRDYSGVIYPSILWANDQYSAILQLTDLVLSSLHGAYRKYLIEKDVIPDNLEELQNYNIYLKKYFKFFQRSKDGKVDGWGIKLW